MKCDLFWIHMFDNIIIPESSSSIQIWNTVAPLIWLARIFSGFIQIICARLKFNYKVYSTNPLKKREIF